MKISVNCIILFVILCSGSVTAQTETIEKIQLKGLVVDYDNKPIKGVRIFVDSLKTRAKTDKNGNYKVTITKNNKLITAYSDRHGLINIDYNGENRVNFIFPKETVLISKREFSQMGYGIFNYEVNPIDYSSYTDIFQLLRTKFQNIEIIGEQIRIKGGGLSLSNGNNNPAVSPLFIVNGSQVSNINSINPADIKKISVERANTSLYGSRGAGGVIKITLKR